MTMKFEDLTDEERVWMKGFANGFLWAAIRRGALQTAWAAKGVQGIMELAALVSVEACQIASRNDDLDSEQMSQESTDEILALHIDLELPHPSEPTDKEMN